MVRHKLNLATLPYDGTTVSVGQSKEHIQKLLVKAGADGIGWEDAYKPKRLSQLVFFRNDKKYRLTIPIHTDDLEKERYHISQATWDDYMVKRERAMFRAMFYYLEGLFKAEQHGLMTFEQAFIGHSIMYLPQGQEVTVNEAMLDMKYTPGYSLPEGQTIKVLEDR